MILRRITQHVRDQSWASIAIDFVMVVVGVFIGIQVSNWNTSRAEDARERLPLGELRTELVESVRQLIIKRDAYDQVGRSGREALAFPDAGAACGADCRPVVVDVFHASQWQQVPVGRTTYDEMRRNGCPRDRAIVDAIEDYHRQADQLRVPLERPPADRSLVRDRIPLAAHPPHRTHCFELTDGEELYLGDCRAGVDPEVAGAAVEAIVAHPDVHVALMEWAGFAGALSVSIDPMLDAAERAISLNDADLDA